MTPIASHQIDAAATDVRGGRLMEFRKKINPAGAEQRR
jgi:hypothetical protein